jgi:methionyl-tRNA synthetase
MKNTITFDDFVKIEIRIGTVVEAREVEGSDKLIRQVVDFGEEIGTRIIFSGIKAWYAPAGLEGKQLPYVINLKPRPMPSYVETPEGKMREESQGMLLAAAPEEDGEHTAALFSLAKRVPNGTEVI